MGDFYQRNQRLAGLQELAARHHRASVECTRLARESRKMEDRLVLEEFARRESEIAAALERRAVAWQEASDRTIRRFGPRHGTAK